MSNGGRHRVSDSIARDDTGKAFIPVAIPFRGSSLTKAAKLDSGS